MFVNRYLPIRQQKVHTNLLKKIICFEHHFVNSFPRKFDVLKKIVARASRANMLVLRTSNFQGATIRAGLFESQLALTQV